MKFDRSLRRILPRSLLGRSTLIVLIPLLVTQAVVLSLFYGTYLNLMSRRLSDGVTGQISLVLSMVEQAPSLRDRQKILKDASLRTQLQFSFQWGGSLTRVGTNHILGPMDDDFAKSLTQEIRRPFWVDWSQKNEMVKAYIASPGGVLNVEVPQKRLTIGPIWLFVVWVFSSSALLFIIAWLFMRNQVRAIRRLSIAAESFGLGRVSGPIRPQGAREVRRAAVAFNRMQERINRFVTQRTAVLAGVSHDLRTPLTRLRLSMAMLPVDGVISAQDLQPDIADMINDIEDMERLIGSYLSFARGEGAEQPALIDIRSLIEDVTIATRRAGGVVMGVEGDISVEAIVRPDALRRALTNLAENSRKYGNQMKFSVWDGPRNISIIVEDDGPGIPVERRAKLFEVDGSGRSRDGRIGLIIVRDIVHAHGGTIKLQESVMGGLKVVLSLPK
ncbi:ATP-binding protein [Swingsia samuiensis]|uniref:histidine kinase n=1 Tax=Swingsia samuiensis TaxID=1293412 RepID=A0A4Y6UIF5_9PROT|nr:ATP-binding protein [Swingsia samuiensis]QDH16236.1 HAMP domain-containing protein [Swingsia samuiensis]